MSKYPFVKQEGFKDCGVASLLMIIKYYNGFISLEKLRDLTHTTKLGVNAYNMCEAAREIGFNADGLKISLDDFKKQEVFLPAIVHVNINNYGHYMVVYKINYRTKKILIADPLTKIKTMTFDEFSNIWNGIIINLYPIRTIPLENDESIFSFITCYIKPHKKLLISIFLLSIFITIFSILSSLYFKTIVDSLNTSHVYIFLIFIIFIVIEVIKQLNSFLRNKLIVFLDEKLDMNMTSDIYKKIIFLPYQYYRNRTTGEIISRLNDINMVKDTIIKYIISIFMDLPILLVSLIVLSIINLNMLYILLFIIIIYILLFFILKIFISKNIADIQLKKDDYTSLAVESISGFETLKNLNIEDSFNNKIAAKYYNFLDNNFRLQNIINIRNFLGELVLSLGVITIIFYGSLKIYDNNFTLGSLLVTYSLVMYVVESIKNILNLDINYNESKNALKRIVGIFNDYKEDGVLDKIKFDKIIFNNLNYSYNNYERVLSKINLEIKRGDKILITGSSGSGKSTLLKLLMKYYEVDNNKIYIDDVDINYYKTEIIRDSITYISQNEILFSDTLFNNININNNNISEIIKLCEIDKIMDKRNITLNYVIEENGFNLSGGEKQRIILGRALNTDFKILLIDEGLNQMDVNLERRILKRIFSKYSDKTIIIVSHRLDNLDLYDRNIEIVKGKVVKDVMKNK